MVGGSLTADLVTRLGGAYAAWSGGESVLIGRETRESGPALEGALGFGLSSAGSTVVRGGVLPTPAVALLAEESGAVVSASHNPPEYNGVKFFRGGWKLEDAEEEAIEGLLKGVTRRTGAVPAERGQGSGSTYADRYVELVCERFGGSLEGLQIVVDCAN